MFAAQQDSMGRPASSAMQSIALAHRIRQWQRLREAHTAMRAGHVERALPLYLQWGGLRRIQQYYGVIGLTGSAAPPDDDTASLASVCLFLCEYSHWKRVWADWRVVCEPVFTPSLFDALSNSDKSRLISARGFASIRQHVAITGWPRRLGGIVRDQRAALQHFAHTGLEKGLHCMVIGYAHEQRREAPAALSYLQRAVELIPIEEEPFYALLAEEYLATAYYFLNEMGAGYYDEAIRRYEAIEAQAGAISGGLDFTDQAYNLGIAFTEVRRYDEARTSLLRGLANLPNDEPFGYRRALYQYGLGFCAFHSADLDAAAGHLSAAITVFVDHSWLMTAMCANLLSSVYHRLGRPTDALREAQKALDNQRAVDNPVQMYHVFRRLTKAYLANRVYPNAMRYFLVTLAMKFRLRKPLWPF